MISSFLAQGRERVKTHTLCLWRSVVKPSESRMTQLHLFYFSCHQRNEKEKLAVVFP